MQEKKERRRRAKANFALRNITGNLGVDFTIVKAFVCNSLASLCCGYLGAPPIYVHVPYNVLYVQAAF